MSEPDWRAVRVSQHEITVWPVAPDGQVSSPETLPRAALATLAGPVIAAGLSEAARSVPGKPDLTTMHVPDLPHVAAIRPLRQERPAALTRGAETAIAGYLMGNPQFDGVLLILGEETCWAHISAEEVVSFQTFLTPALLAALEASAPTLGDAFDAALTETLSRPDRLAQHLASAKASASGHEAAHLIGAEIAAAKPYWLGQEVVILAKPGAAAPHLRALEHQGVQAREADLDAAYLDGFRAAWAALTS